MDRPSFYALRPAELAPLLGGTGRARLAWAMARRGLDPFSPGVLPGRGGARLDAVCRALPLRSATRTRSACGTVKLTVALDAGGVIETVVIPNRGRSTVCVSSQVGCARGCGFCATAAMGLQRSLDAGEIVAQVKLGIDLADERGMPRVRNVVFMGMGEPLDNLAATARAVRVMVDPLALALAPGNVTLSTIGTSTEAIRKAAELPVRLAWSLHSADDATRRLLVPTARVPVAELREAFREAVTRGRRRLFVEVTLMAGVNDRPSDAEGMAAFLLPLRERVRVNLLPLNPGREGYAPSDEGSAGAFRDVLRRHGYFCNIRRPRGAPDAAACGQLATAPGAPVPGGQGRSAPPCPS